MLFIIGVIAGLILPIQTSINTKLKNTMHGSAFLASMVSFIIGTITLFVANVVQGNSLLIPLNVFTNQPFWIWLGGALGVIGLTANILIFPYLGAVQTVVLPILGQIIMGMIIDNFALFDAPVHHFTIMRLIGIVILLLGILMIVIKKKAKSDNKNNKTLWQLIGLIAGMFQASQAPINGHLGIVLESSGHAALVSFFIGAVILIIIAYFTDRGYHNVKNAVGTGKPWWIWIGGSLGAFFVMSNAYLSPIIGAGTVVILTLLGNLLGGIILDRFGIGTSKKKITLVQYLGIIVMFIGVVIVKLF